MISCSYFPTGRADESTKKGFETYGQQTHNSVFSSIRLQQIAKLTFRCVEVEVKIFKLLGRSVCYPQA